MHLAEGVLSARESLGWSIAVLPWVLRGLKNHQRVSRAGLDARQRAAEAFAGVLLFACSSLPIPVPYLGFSVHLCLTPLLALLFGFRRIPFYVSLFLFVQAVCTGHGGLSTLGINVFSLGILGPILGVGLGGHFKKPIWVGLTCGVAVGVIYLFDAIILGTQMHAIHTLDCWKWVAGIFVILLPLIILEGVLSGVLWGRLAKGKAFPFTAENIGHSPGLGRLDRGLIAMLGCLSVLAFFGTDIPDLDDFLVLHASTFQNNLAPLGFCFLIGLCFGFCSLLHLRRTP